MKTTFDYVDRYLRNNLDDETYAAFMDAIYEFVQSEIEIAIRDYKEKGTP